ncbi:hypothetical protein NIES4071_24060 [Calothrix sp. NIES-4071]|nr:hypothetical protein NIES4071_24060 [Calothrix sp. NIES-4071]BAZ56729.1 hypothetical protein NIES4105_24000 [Calothrix sp. NIES-4105]
MSTNDEEISENVRRQLDEIEAALILAQSKEYFKDTVRKIGALKALEQFQSEAARSAMVNPRIEEIRKELGLGLNIEGSPTVALIIANIPGIEGEYQGVSGRFEANVVSDLKLGAVSLTHAEGRALAKLANEMKIRNIIGGEATLYVDKPLCNYCQKVVYSITKQYGVKLTIVSP